ncbi:MAG: hypothetical protein SGJ24_16250 [Chloroflexota bacterium]|nr:hypothetical protein [Chloroflexota bacterium]
MAAKSNKLGEIILKAIDELHKRSSVPDDEQWFTRAAIARQMGVPSQRLNPVRVRKVEELASEGKIQKRQKPDDGRDLPQYRNL